MSISPVFVSNALDLDATHGNQFLRDVSLPVAPVTGHLSRRTAFAWSLITHRKLALAEPAVWPPHDKRLGGSRRPGHGYLGGTATWRTPENSRMLDAARSQWPSVDGIHARNSRCWNNERPVPAAMINRDCILPLRFRSSPTQVGFVNAPSLFNLRTRRGARLQAFRASYARRVRIQ